MTQKEKELNEKQARLVDKMEAISDKAEKGGWTNELHKKHENLYNEVKEIQNKIRQIKASKGNYSDSQPVNNAGPNGVGISQNNDMPEGVEIWESVSGANQGQQIRVLHNNRSLHEDLKNQHGSDFDTNLNWENYIRNQIAGGNYLSQEEFENQQTTYKNVMGTTADSSLVPAPLSTEVIDKARNKSRVMQAGARTVPMGSKTLDIARVTDDPTPEWKAESDAFSHSDVSVDGITLTAKTLVAGTKTSIELAEDASNASQVIRNSLSESLALELDRAALVGSGTGEEPEGLYNNSNVQEVTMGTDGSVIDDFTELSQAYQKVLEKNGEARSAIFAPRTWGQIDRLTDSNSNPLQHPQSWKDLQKLVTNQVPTDQDQGTSTGVSSSVFIGDFRQMLVGMRTNLRIEVSRVASDSSDSAWENLEIWIRAYLRADIQYAHPAHFCRVVGLIE